MYSSISVCYTQNTQSMKRCSLDLQIDKYSPTKNLVSYPYGTIKEESTTDKVNKHHKLKCFPYNGEMCKSTEYPRKCVQLSYSCNEINYTDSFSLQSSQPLNKDCSSSKSICVPDTSFLPVENLHLEDEVEINLKTTDSNLTIKESVPSLNVVEKEKNSPVKNNMDVIVHISDFSETLEHTNPNSDCITSTTEDDTFYSPLEELSVSTLSLSIDLSTESISTGNFETNPSYSLCCDVFTVEQIEETNSVLGEDLEVDKTEDDRPSSEDQKSNENISAMEPAVLSSKHNITDCFPI